MAQSCKTTPPLQMPITAHQLLTISYRLEVPMTSSSGSINFLELLTELRETCSLLHCQLIIEDITQKQPDGRDTEGQVWGRDSELL